MAKKMTEADYKIVFEKAHKAADQAVADFLKKHGDQMYCGFAWVRITKGQTPVVNAYKKIYANDPHKLGHKGYPNGWEIWSPGRYNGQSMDVKEEAARAFAAVLREAGIDAWMESRPD
jgi:hypothetical protein